MPRPARGFCFGGTAPPKSATYARAREARPPIFSVRKRLYRAEIRAGARGTPPFLPFRKRRAKPCRTFFSARLWQTFACPPLASAGHRMARPDLRHGCELAHPWRVLPGAIGIRGGEARGFCLRKNLQWGPMARRPPICGPLRARARPFDAFQSGQETPSRKQGGGRERGTRKRELLKQKQFQYVSLIKWRTPLRQRDCGRTFSCGCRSHLQGISEP
jgi:hypothetical protein